MNVVYWLKWFLTNMNDDYYRNRDIMAINMEAMRRKLQELEDGKKTKTSGKSVTYPFWDIDFDAQARIRFLPDGDATNSFFWREKQTIRLPFAGVVGGDEAKEVFVTVPCANMFVKNTCPIIRATRSWWDDPSLVEAARKYYMKRTVMYQGFVIESPLKEDEPPENPIRLFSFTNKLHTHVKQAILDVDSGVEPVAYTDGTDFIIKKTRNGQWPEYSTSTWARKNTSLTEKQLADIETYGLYDLSTFMPKQPSAEALVAIEEMFVASSTGELYDPARWSAFYAPYGVDTQSHNKGTAAPSSASRSDDDDDHDDYHHKPAAVTASAAPASAAPSSADAILASIRNRKAQ